MLKAETLAAYRAGLDRVSDGAAQYVERMLREAAARHPDMTVAEWRDFAAAVMQAAAETYGEAGASLACELYDARVRASGYDKATMGITLDPARAMATARYQAGKLVGGDLDGFIRECSAFCSDYVREVTNSTMTGNWKRSRRSASRSRSAAAKAGNAYGVRFARVPQGGDTCTFCAMLASSGFVYWSRETAGEFDHYHRNCKCLVVPDDGSGEVEGYDPDEWLQRWKAYEEIDARDDLTRAEKDHEKRIYPYMQNAIGAVYSRLYAERDIEVANCDFRLKQNQLIHVEGSAQNRIAATGRGIEPSCFTMDEKEILELIKQYAGHGTPDDSRNDGEWSRKEICTADKVVGYVVNRKGERIPTRCFKIHYADNGVHAVPRYDDGGEPNDISR